MAIDVDATRWTSGSGYIWFVPGGASKV